MSFSTTHEFDDAGYLLYLCQPVSTAYFALSCTHDEAFRCGMSFRKPLCSIAIYKYTLIKNSCKKVIHRYVLYMSFMIAIITPGQKFLPRKN